MRISDWSSDVCSSDLVAFRSWRRLACPLAKEVRARLAPALLCRGVFRRRGAEQCTGEHVGIERIGSASNDEFAELANAAFLEGLRLRFERLPFRIKIPWFAHGKSPLCDDEAMIIEGQRSEEPTSELQS